MNQAQTAQTSDQQSAVLSKAVIRAAERLAIPRNRLAKILGVSAPTVTRLFTGDWLLEPSRKEWELALLFVRLYRALDSIVGEDQVAKAWLQSHNQALLGCPAELIQTTEGLVRVVHYLDASRGRI